MKMKIYQTIQMNLALLGFKENLRPFNKRQKLCFVAFFISLATIYVYLLCVASKPKEYMDSIFVTAVGSFVCISYISSVFKMETLFIFINGMEEGVNGSE